MAIKYPSEHEEQTGFINWFRPKYPHLVIFAIPNGEKRAISVAKRLKKEGVLAGVPDLCVLLPNSQVLFIEMKAMKGRLSEVQKEIIPRFEWLGHTVIVARGAAEASSKFMDYIESLK